MSAQYLNGGIAYWCIRAQSYAGTYDKIQTVLSATTMDQEGNRILPHGRVSYESIHRSEEDITYMSWENILTGFLQSPTFAENYNEDETWSAAGWLEVWEMWSLASGVWRNSVATIIFMEANNKRKATRF